MSATVRLSVDERNSFEGTPAPTVVTGPLVLMRLAGRTAHGEANNPYGRFWFAEDYFWDVIDFLTHHHTNVALVNHYLKLVMREGFAICHDWNSFGRLYRLRIPRGIRIHAFVGRAKAQPFFSDSDPLKRQVGSSQLLMGGEVQYIVDINAETKRYVEGPLPFGIHGTGRA